jgi:hypothetical protein
MKPEPKTDRPVSFEREEDDALMSELGTAKTRSKPPPSAQEIEEKFRRIEFCMMIIVGLLIAALVFSKAD